MTDWTERLSEYLDGDLSGEERTELEAALRSDPELKSVLQALRRVREAAAALPVAAPAGDLWPGIESRIRANEERAVVPLADTRSRRRLVSLTIPQLAAAAVALLVLGSASVWVAMSAGDGAGDGAGPVVTAPVPQAALVSSDDGSSFSYEAAIEDLEAQLRIGRDRLDPKTVAALQGSLATIDRAIEQARAALEADPASVYLNRHLADARTRKLRVLQQAAVLASS